MSQRQKIFAALLVLLLLISLMGNVALFLWGRYEARLAVSRQTEIEALRQELEDLRQELRELRAQSMLPETMNTIAGRTEELRDLEPLAEVTRRLVSQEEMGQFLMQKLAEEYPAEDARQDEAILATLELIPPDLDLSQTLNDLFSEQVAGLYDPEEETLYVVSFRGGMGALEKVTFAHEYTHALQDQHFDLEALGVGTRETDRNDDELVAIHALVEGDAMFSMQQYMLTHFGPLDMVGLVGAALTIDQTALNQAPSYLRKSMTFPYQDGLLFATYLYGRGGWPAIDAAYANPPQSSEQILHPFLYPDDTPQLVTLPPLTGTLSSDWQLVDENVLGEFGLRLYLDVYLTQRQASEAAAGWGGDRYAVYENVATEQVLLVILIAWDDEFDRDEFGEIYQKYAGQRFGKDVRQIERETQQEWIGEDVLFLAQADNDSALTHTLIVLAPDVATAEQVVGEVEDF